MSEIIFPTLVFKDKGPHQRPGGTYDYKGVADQAALETLLQSGWFLTLTEAIAGKSEKAPPSEPVAGVPTADQIRAYSRPDLEALAAEFELKYPKKTTDPDLAELIIAYMEKAGAWAGQSVNS